MNIVRSCQVSLPWRKRFVWAGSVLLALAMVVLGLRVVQQDVPLELAIDNCDLERVGELMNAEGWTGDSSDFQHAMECRGPELVEQLLVGGADPNMRFEDGPGEPLGPPNGQTPLFRARNDALVKVLVGAGAKVDQLDDGGRTPLYESANAGVADALLEAGADPNSSDIDENAPLAFAVDSATQEVLLRAGADPNHQDQSGDTALLSSTSEPDQVQGLLDAGADPNIVSNNGHSPLFRAVFYGEQESAELLMDHGANVNQRADVTLAEALLAVTIAEVDDYKVVQQLLVGIGMDSDLVPKNQSELNDAVTITDSPVVGSATPLYVAVVLDDAEVVRLLGRAGADPAYPAASGGATPIDAASLLGNQILADELSQIAGE